ncbi:hypothetical protein ACPCSP_25530 [Streptomyces cinereoruber]|uniref:hypothetical protein n=1 Tax=Streptomyces cinereoruber TaxID=67260 RepID=UPI003C2E2649
MIGKLIPEALAQAITAEAMRHEADPVRQAQVLNVLAAANYTVNEIAELAGTTWHEIETTIGLLALVDLGKDALDQGLLYVSLARHIAQLSEANQNVVLIRWIRGDFKNEAHATRYVQALIEDEGTVLGLN